MTIWHNVPLLSAVVVGGISMAVGIGGYIGICSFPVSVLARNSGSGTGSVSVTPSLACGHIALSYSSLCCLPTGFFVDGKELLFLRKIQFHR
jgi:hypothetical protein